MVKHQKHMQHLQLPQHHPNRHPNDVNVGNRDVQPVYLFECKLPDKTKSTM